MRIVELRERTAKIAAPIRNMREHGWAPARCIPHGGHQLSLAIAAGLGLGGNESYPDLFQPFGGFPDGVEVQDGHVELPELPGIGFEGRGVLHRTLSSLFDGGST